jgi:hypothetical protein
VKELVERLRRGDDASLLAAAMMLHSTIQLLPPAIQAWEAYQDDELSGPRADVELVKARAQAYHDAATRLFAALEADAQALARAGMPAFPWPQPARGPS